MCYAVFETGVQIGRLKSRAVASVFPLLIAVGGAVLLVHSHALGNVKEELLIEMSHNSIAVFAVLAGWTRWLEVRLPQAQGGRIVRLAGLVWPVCLVLIACLLLNYREAYEKASFSFPNMVTRIAEPPRDPTWRPCPPASNRT
jgi:copper resistance protein D